VFHKSVVIMSGYAQHNRNQSY